MAEKGTFLFSVDTLGNLTMTLFNASATQVLDLELAASVTDGTSKNIASPRVGVVTGDKTPVTIEAGIEIPYQQASSSGATNVAFKKAVLGLTVTPQIAPDDSVIMQISVSQDSIGASLEGGAPTINAKESLIKSRTLQAHDVSKRISVKEMGTPRRQPATIHPEVSFIFRGGANHHDR